PLNADPDYAPARVNVADQQARADSLLHWLRNLLAVRRRHPVFGGGGFELIQTGDPAVLGYRRFDAETETTVLANFATTNRAVRLNGRMADLSSGRVHDGQVELAGRGFCWLGGAE
ncbi:MAG: DUF3459 domain-containing protein, partial [bacterium]|nr:DUF3459 domain-containing protein [bacterium]